MTTFNDLVDEVQMYLSGFGMRSNALTHLTQNATASDTQIKVSSAESIGKGTVEIDDELIWVDVADRTTGVLTIPPYGRGFQRTTAGAHTAGTMVTINPIYTRHAIKIALNDTIRTCGLNGVGYYAFTSSPATNTYSLPDSVDDVLSVTYKSVGPSGEWPAVKSWRFDSSANASDRNSTKTITIKSFIDPGAEVQVVYSFDPDVLETNNDDFEMSTGLDEQAKDVIVYGAAWRLLSFVPSSRVQYVTPESNAQQGAIDVNSGTNIAKYVYALYQQRLAEEKERFVRKYAKRIHYTS